MIDDDPDIWEVIDALLGSSQLAAYQLSHTDDIAEAIALARTGNFDVCLVDHNLNQSLSGIDLIDQLNGNPTPMVLITADQCQQLDYQAMQVGAVGFVHKEDLSRSVLDRTLRYAVARNLRIQELEMETAEHKMLALTDELTGLPNRREFERRVNATMALAAGKGEQFALVYIDLNGFKRVNDTHGHDVGDRILQVIASRLLGEFREGDSLCRIGGDEFVAIITQSNPSIAVSKVCEPLIERLAERAAGAIEVGHLVIHVGASFGLATYPHDGTDLPTLLKAADENMFTDKKNRIYA